MKANILHVGSIIATLFGALPAHAEGGGWVGIEMVAGQHGGVGVRAVVPASPAASTDLALGDEILSIDGALVHEPKALRSEIMARPIGRRMKLVVVRDDKRRDVIVAPAARPSEVEMVRKRLVGRPAPAFSLPRANSSKLGTLAEHHGKPLLIDFWATWCGPCVMSLPTLDKMRVRYAGKLDVIGISSEPSRTVGHGVTELGIAHPVLIDEQEAAFVPYGVVALPTLVLVDGQGVVRDVEVGANPEALTPAIEQLIK